MLQQAPRPGLAALLQVSGVEPEQVTAERISFTLAPRLNAAGRMDDATASLRLLLTEDEEEAQQLAQELNNYNLERQKTEHDIVDQIAERIRADAELSRRRVIVVWGEGYHQGVIGIVASRLVERFGRPAIVFSIDGDEAKGSGRSVPGFSLYEAVAACSDKLLRFGGHDLAAGMGDELFTGDTLFAGDIGRTDLAGGSYAEIQRSLHKLLSRVEGDPRVLPGHEEFSTFLKEKEQNRYLK